MRIIFGVFLVIAVGCSAEFGAASKDNQDDQSDNDVDDDDIDPQTIGLVAWFPLDTIDETGSPDTIGGQNATCDATCPTPTTGMHGNAASVNNQHLTVTDDGRFSFPSGFSVAGWGNPTTLTGFSCIATQPYTGGTNNVWALCLDDDGLPFFYGGGNNIINGQTPTAVDEWIHLSVTWDGQTARFYVNAVEVGSKDIDIVFDDSTDLVIAGDKDNGSATAPWHGALDDIRIYNRVLTASELQSLLTP